MIEDLIPLEPRSDTSRNSCCGPPRLRPGRINTLIFMLAHGELLTPSARYML